MLPNWEDIKAEYVTSDISYRNLADKHGVNHSTLIKRAGKDKWVAARKKYKNAVVNKVVQKTATARANKLAALQEAADGMGHVINRVLKDAEQFNRHIVTIGTGAGASDAEERIYKKADARAIRDMAAAMKDLAVTVRNLYGILTEPERAAMEIAAARLALERQKVNEGTPDDNDTGVVVIAEVLPEEGDANE